MVQGVFSGCVSVFQFQKRVSVETIYHNARLQANQAAGLSWTMLTCTHTQVTTGGASVLHEGGCRVYLGKLGSVPARLYVKGRGELQRSKRRSIMAFYDILGQRIASGRSEEPLAVLHMDADTGSAEPGG